MTEKRQGQKVRVVHYLNQFFGGIGGEEFADAPPQWFAGARGPGQLLARASSQIEVVGTVVAGDNYVAERIDEAVAELVALISRELHGEAAHLLLAGPAFSAGRYGMACAALCQGVEEQLGMCAVTAVHAQNPAVDSYRRHVTMVRAAADVMGMSEALAALVRVGLKRVRGEPIDAQSDNTFTAGLRANYFASATGAERAIDMLLAKLGGDDFSTEYPMPVFDRVAPAPALASLESATIALVTSGGIVPRDNPDHIEAANASRYGEYSLHGVDALSAQTHQSVHGGYDPTYANEDPNRVLPVDVLRQLEREGRIGHLHETYYATVGNATSVASAKRYGAEIAAKLINVGVQAVVFTST